MFHKCSSLPVVWFREGKVVMKVVHNDQQWAWRLSVISAENLWAQQKTIFLCCFEWWLHHLSSIAISNLFLTHVVLVIFDDFLLLKKQHHFIHGATDVGHRRIATFRALLKVLGSKKPVRLSSAGNSRNWHHSLVVCFVNKRYTWPTIDTFKNTWLVGIHIPSSCKKIWSIQLAIQVWPSISSAMKSPLSYLVVDQNKIAIDPHSGDSSCFPIFEWDILNH